MEELDCVKLTKTFKNLKIGCRGVILIKYNDKDFEVEFVDNNDNSLGVYTISKDFIEVYLKYNANLNKND